MLFGHGDDIYTHNKKIVSNFSSNVIPLYNSELLFEFISHNLAVLSSYPEPNAISFTEVLAEQNNISPSQVCVTHGATDAIYLIAQYFRDSKSLIFAPTFAEYEDACRVNHHQIDFFYTDEELYSSENQLVWLCNPNNPTGKTWEYKKLISIIENQPDTIYIIDQTYRYFTQEETISYTDAITRKNVILIDSFTKRYGLPDLRLGYIIAHQDIIQKIQKYKQPWSVSQLAIETGKYILMNKTSFPLDINKLLKERTLLQNELHNLSSLEVFSTDTHFFLCRIAEKKAKVLKRHLIETAGILIRNADNFRGLDPHYLRLSTQTSDENRQLVLAIKNFIQC